MVSKFKLFAILVIALFSGKLVANTNPNTDPQGTPVSDNGCVLPPPTTLMVPEIGTSWYRATWSPVPGASQYQITTRDALTNSILNITYAPASVNSVLVTGFVPGTSVVPEIRSICYDFTLGPPKIGPTTGIIVIDIVGSSYKPGNSYIGAGCDNMGTTLQSGCNINSNNGSGEFEIYNNSGASAYFRSFKSPQGHISIEAEENPSPFTFQVPGNGYYVDISVGADIVARLSTGMTAGNRMLFRCNSAICGVENDISYTIRKVAQTGMSQSSLDSRFDEDIDSPRTIATPNPFADLLEIQIPFATAENELHLALYDLQGRMMMMQHIANGGPIQTIETGNLPTGVYFLRVECAGKAETIKVVKTQ